MDRITSLSVPHELSKDEREQIVAHLNDLEASGTNVWKMRFLEYTLPGRPKLFIKLDPDVVAEASTQHFFYLCAQGDNSAPGIPKVFDAFYSAPGYHIMVMEKIDAPNLEDCQLSEDAAVKHAAFAVGWLLDQLPSIPSSCFGKIASKPGAVAKHPFFQDHEAPKPFSGPEDLAGYMSKASKYCASKKHRYSPDEILALLGQGCRIYHSDIRKENFLVNSHGTVYIVDFEHIGVLPEVFQTFSFFNIALPFAAKVGRELGHLPSISAGKIAPISMLLQQAGGSANFSACFMLTPPAPAMRA